MVLRNPCAVCDSSRFGVVRNVAVEVSHHGLPRRLNFTVAVCTGCGATTFIMESEEDHLLNFRHEVVDLNKGPYR